MAVRYKIVKHKQLKNTKTDYHLIPFSPTHIESDKVANEICDCTSFTQGDYDGMIRAIQTQIITALRRGMPIKINRIGKFSLSLGVKKEVDPKRASNMSVYIKTLNFDPDPDILKELMDIKFIKVGVVNERPLSLSVRLDRIEKIIDLRQRVTVWDVAVNNNCSLRTAYRDMNILIKNKIIKRDVKGIFVKHNATNIDLTPVNVDVFDYN